MYQWTQRGESLAAFTPPHCEHTDPPHPTPKSTRSPRTPLRALASLPRVAVWRCFQRDLSQPPSLARTYLNPRDPSPYTLHAPVWSSGMTLPLDTRWSVVRIGPWQKFARRSAAPSFALLCLCIPHFGLHAHLCCMCGEKWERLRCASQAHGPRALSPAPAMHMASVEPGSHPHSSPARQDEGPGLSRMHGAPPRLSPVRGGLGRHHAYAHAPR